MHGCSSNGPGASLQVANWLKTSSKVDIDVRNQFGNILKGLQLKMAIGEAYQAIHVTNKFFCNAVSHPPPPTHLPSAGTFVIWSVPVKKYLKWQIIQLAVEWRVGPLKDHR